MDSGVHGKPSPAFAVTHRLVLPIALPLFGNTSRWLSLNGFLLFRGLFLINRVKPKADQTFRLAQ